MKVVVSLLFIFLLSNHIFSQSYFYSFENTFSGWDTTGIDLQLGDTTIAWSIHPSDEMAVDSSFSMQYHLENYNDAGKIWIQKGFSVEQQKDYTVAVNYKFASMDFGLANLWEIITGVHLSPPATAQQLMYQGHTGNGFNFDTGYVWLDKSYEFNINSDTSNNLWIVIGIWGNWEVARTYYIDSLSIVIQGTPTSQDEDAESVPDYLLYQNYPNPFNPATTISYTIPEYSDVIIKVFNILGSEIETLVNEENPAGHYEVNWNAGNIPSGVYFYRLQAGDFVETKKMILLE